jgi:hypothetical protein
MELPLVSGNYTEIRNQVRSKPNGQAYFYDVALGGPLKKDTVWHYGAFQWIDEKQGSILTLAEPVDLDFYSIHEKVTWQQNEKNRLDLSFSDSPHWACNRPPGISIAPDGKFTQATPGMEFIHAKHTRVFNDSRFMENSFSFYRLSLQSGTTRGRDNIPANEVRLTSWNPELGLFYTTGASPTYSDIRNQRGRYGFRFYQNTASHTVKTGIDYTEQFGHTLIVNNLPGVFAAWIDRQGQPVNRNNERMPSNWTVDLTLGRVFRTAHGSFSPSLQIINLTNRTNVIGVTTSFSGPGIPTNVDTGRLIQIGLGWEF